MKDSVLFAGTAPRLIIFDKDGTLIDFHAMWAGWASTLFERLSAEGGRNLRAPLASAFGCDQMTGRAVAEGPLAVASMSVLYDLAVGVLRQHGVPDAAGVVARSWFIPDPATAAPLTDLTALFTGLRSSGCKIAVLTSDDESPTRATLARLAVADLVDLVIGADSGFAHKPHPEAVLYACERLGVPVAACAVVGDSSVDMQMARAAGATAIAVLSGLSTPATLAPLADLVLPSVAALRQT